MPAGFLQFEFNRGENRRISNPTPFTYSVRFEQKIAKGNSGGVLLLIKISNVTVLAELEQGLTRNPAQILSKAPVSVLVSTAAI